MPRKTANQPATDSELPPVVLGPQGLPAAVEADEPDADALANLMARIRGGEQAENYTVSVYRVRNNVRAAIPGAKFAAPEFDEFTFADRYGGGRFFARVTDQRGQYRDGVTFNIDGPERAAPPADQPPPAHFAPVQQADPLSIALDRIMDRIERIEARASNPEQLGTLQIVELAKALRPDPAPAAQQIGIKDILTLVLPLMQRSPLADVVDGMRTVKQLAAGEGGSEESGGLAALAPMLAQIVAGMNQPQPAAPRPQAPRPPASPAPAATPAPAPLALAQAAPAPNPPPAAAPAADALAPDELAYVGIMLNIAAQSTEQDADPAGFAERYADNIADAIGPRAAGILAHYPPGELAAAVIAAAPTLEAHREFVERVEAALRDIFTDDNARAAVIFAPPPPVESTHPTTTNTPPTPARKGKATNKAG